MQHSLTFEHQKAIYLLVNMIGHDVFHDFGTSSMQYRFEAVKQLLGEFDKQVVGGGNSKTRKNRRSPTGVADLSPTGVADLSPAASATAPPPGVSQLSYRIATMPPPGVSQLSYRSATLPPPGPRNRSRSRSRSRSRRSRSVHSIKIRILKETIRMNRTKNETYRILSKLVEDVDGEIVARVAAHIINHYSKTKENPSLKEITVCFVVPNQYQDRMSPHVKALNRVFSHISSSFFEFVATNYKNEFDTDAVEIKVIMNILEAFLELDVVINCLHFYFEEDDGTIGGAKDAAKAAAKAAKAVEKLKKQTASKAAKDAKRQLTASRNIAKSIDKKRKGSHVLVPQICESFLQNFQTIDNDINQNLFPRLDDPNYTDQDYTSDRKNYMRQFKNIVQVYIKDNKVVNYYNGLIDNILPSKPRVAKAQYLRNIKLLTKECQDIIAMEVEVQRQKEAYQQLLAASAASGILTPDDVLLKNQFMQMCLKMALYYTGICDKDGNNTIGQIDYVPLKAETDLLYAITGWPTVNKQTTAIDSRLFDHWKDTLALLESIHRGAIIANPPSVANEFAELTKEDIEQSVQRKGRCIINNASSIGNLVNHVVCTLSSILDGMSNCSGQTSNGRLEVGNMDFVITDTRHTNFYHCVLNTTAPAQVDVMYTLQCDGKQPVTGRVHIPDFKQTDYLEAPKVLLRTMTLFLQFVSALARLDMSITNDVFASIFDQEFANPDYFQVIFGNILDKLLGDLLQEVNAVCKFGGYSSPPTSSPGVIRYDANGDALRVFTANDQPSALRFIMMLLEGNQAEINLNAMGGYWGEHKHLLIHLDP